jgi:hypothetical protein
VFGALIEVTAGRSSAPIGWWDGTNRQAAPRRPHGGDSIILTTCTFLRLGEVVRQPAQRDSAQCSCKENLRADGHAEVRVSSDEESEAETTEEDWM